MTNQDEPKPESMATEVGRELVREAGRWFRWAAAGALVGAAVLGGVGAYVAGWTGLGLGAAVGAVLGGVGAWWFYVEATSIL